MTSDLQPRRGRVFIGPILGKIRIATVQSVRYRKDNTPASCVLVYEEASLGGPFEAELRIRLPKTGELSGLRRVTLDTVGTAREVASATGRSFFTDAVCIVTKDRTGGGKLFGGDLS